ncbi:MAG: cysteine desulfurase [Bacteroidales bacterium]|nr:cysteine desulfurase [Bacteroidales bacterium]MCF8402849.1 cysteine desulfurase [Bacteroidales bacterium]
MIKSGNSIIYLDNNATTPIDPRVLEAMMPYLTSNFANASSTHKFGVKAYEAVKAARKQVAELIGAETNEIIFTSGATEAINLALKGYSDLYSEKGKHIITVTTEHSAVLDTCKELERKGFEVTYLPVQNDGLIELEKLKNAIRKDTLMVSVMIANNETGVIQSIKEISEIAHSVDAVFMTDATQAVGKIPVDVDELGIDLMCLSGHKIYAPKGVGALFVRQRSPYRIKLTALLNGGGHERGFRSGTLNVPGIVALGKACEIAGKEMNENAEKILKMRNYLEAELLKIDGTFVNGNLEHRLFNTSNICFKGIDSEALILGLSNPEGDLPLIAVSNGSACTSASIDPSHVLMAMGLDENLAFNCIRFSLGKDNAKEEIDVVINQVKNIVNSLASLTFD